MGNSNCILIKWFKKLFDYNKLNNSKTDVSDINVPIMENETTSIHIDDTMPDFLKTDKADVSVSKDILDKESLVDVSKSVVVDDGETEIIIKDASLLDNKMLVKVFGECADIINELDRMSPNFKSSDSQVLLEHINDRIRQALFLSGGKPISDDKAFDSLRHFCPDNIMAKDGTPIASFIESGVVLEDRVFVKAKVTLK